MIYLPSANPSALASPSRTRGRLAPRRTFPSARHVSGRSCDGSMPDGHVLGSYRHSWVPFAAPPLPLRHIGVAPPVPWPDNLLLNKVHGSIPGYGGNTLQFHPVRKTPYGCRGSCLAGTIDRPRGDIARCRRVPSELRSQVLRNRTTG